MTAIYLKQIEMTGVFGYKDLSWTIHRDVNILGGANGSGKSTVFHICFSLLANGFIDEGRYAEDVKTVKLGFTNGCTLEWDKQVVDDKFKNLKGYLYHPVDDGRINKDGLRLVQRTRVLDANGETLNPEELIAAVPTDFLSSFEQVLLDAQKTGKEEKNADRTYLDVLLTENIASRNRKLSQILINSYSPHGDNEPENGRHQYFIAAKDARYLSLFNKALLEFFGEDYKIKAGMEAQITMISKKTGKEIAYQDLSLGEKEVLLLILKVSNTYDAPVLMWLDEPDLGLHVDWQVKLIRNLRDLNPNIQLLVSTHAPSMVEGNFEKVTEMTKLTREGR